LFLLTLANTLKLDALFCISVVFFSDATSLRLPTTPFNLACLTYLGLVKLELFSESHFHQLELANLIKIIIKDQFIECQHVLIVCKDDAEGCAVIELRKIFTSLLAEDLLQFCLDGLVSNLTHL
jgi:hypothetical protein